jgi:hypothetical protein
VGEGEAALRGELDDLFDNRALPALPPGPLDGRQQGAADVGGDVARHAPAGFQVDAGLFGDLLQVAQFRAPGAVEVDRQPGVHGVVVDDRRGDVGPRADQRPFPREQQREVLAVAVAVAEQEVAEGGGEHEDRFFGFAGGAQQAAGGG